MAEKPVRRLAHSAAWIVLAFLIAPSGGCATLSLATLGSIFEAAGSAASTGNEVFSLGKLDTAQQVRLDEALAALHQTAADLNLRFKPTPQDLKQKDPLTSVLRFLDDKDGKIVVTIEQRTATLMRIRIDVGWFGSQVTARLFLNRLRAHLPLPNPPPRPRAVDPDST